MTARRRDFGSVRQRPNGSWQARYRDTDGEDRYAVFATKAEASSHLSKMRADLDRGDWFDPKEGKKTVGDWADEWMASKRQIRYRTRENYERSIRNEIVPHLGRVKLTALTPERVDSWICELESAGTTEAVVNGAYKVLRLMMKVAVQRRYVRYNPCDPVEAPALPVRDQLFLNPAQVADLADALGRRGPQYRTLVLLSAYGGLRWGEATGLAVGHVDTLRRQVRVERQLHPNGTLDVPKTKAGTRAVTIPPWLADQLALTISSRTPAPDLSADHADLVFLTPDGKRLHPSNFNRRVWRPAVVASLPAHLHALRYHDLRHTAVAIALDAARRAGEPLNAKALQERMGHSSVQMTFDRYGHLFDRHDSAMVAAMDDPFATRPAPAEVRTLRG